MTCYDCGDADRLVWSTALALPWAGAWLCADDVQCRDKLTGKVMSRLAREAPGEWTVPEASDLSDRLSLRR